VLTRSIDPQMIDAEEASHMANSNRDPRSEAEKAIADLKRNAEMDMSVTESALERQPSVTPDTFGVHDKPARLRSGHDQGVEAGGKLPEPPGTQLPDRDG
jgi:hypothetical protein